jgi:hypothetical protein
MTTVAPWDKRLRASTLRAPLELDDPSHDMAFARRSRVKESIDD